jgi:hypothetical protein
MHSLFMVTSLAVALLSTGAQQVPPNTMPPATAKGGHAIGKLNGQKEGENAKHIDSSRPPESPCSQCPTCCPIEQPHSKSKEEQAKQDSLDLLYRRYMWATIIGVGGGLVGVGILIWQAVLTRRAANAAKDSADALINSERAWVLVETAQIRPVYFRASVISPVVKNFGKTIARVRSVKTGIQLLQITQELSSPPAYGEPQGLNFILYPNREFQPIAIPINDENLQSAKDGLLVLYVYGLIEYLDLRDAPKVIGFCLIYCQEKDGVPEGFYPFVKALPSYSHYT